MSVSFSVCLSCVVQHKSIVKNYTLMESAQLDLQNYASIRLMASSAMGLKLVVFGFFADHTRKNECKANTSTVFARRFTLRRFTHVYLHAQTAVDAGSIGTWRTTVILITGKPRRPPIWAPCGDQNGAGFWTPLYICGLGASFLSMKIKILCAKE